MYHTNDVKDGIPLVTMVHEQQYVSNIKHHKKKKVEPRTNEAESFLPIEAHACDSDVSHSLSESLFRVELAFCPKPVYSSFASVDDRSRTATTDELQGPFSTFTPRDLGNLLLWSVPSAIPLIEAPREFFIRNKSRLRSVVMIYVNGWSYDMMMATGVGLPRASFQGTEKGPLSSHREGSDSQESNTRTNKNEPPSPPKWNERICHSLLKPVRTGACWARKRQGYGNLGGVHYAPLAIPNTNNEFEMDLFWRNDAPRVPRDSSRTQFLPKEDSNTASGSCKAETKLTGIDHVSNVSLHDTVKSREDTLGISCSSEFEKPIRGVGDTFKRAQMIASGKQSVPALPPNTSSSPVSFSERDPAISCGGKKYDHSSNGAREEDADLAKDADSGAVDASSLWCRRGHLLKFALHFPEHEVELRALGFILEKPEMEMDASSEGCTASGYGNKACNIAREDSNWDLFSTSDDGNEGGHDSAKKESWCAERPPRVFALDCEMVMTKGQASSLARATLVDAQSSKVVFDMLVKPRTEIIDYLTRYSGIDEETLRDVTNTLVDCQAALKKHVCSSDFIIGHSLENDFKACQMIPNCYVLDTAWLYPHPSGLPYKNSLRYLAMRYLRKRIQQGSHDSAMDAQISLELVQLKLERGPMFGIRQRVSILDLICGGHPNSNETQEDRNVSKSPQDIPIHIQLFDEAQVLSTILPKSNASSTRAASIDVIPVRHDEDATRKVVRALRNRAQAISQTRTAVDGDSYSFIWLQLRETAVNVLVQPSLASSAAKDDEVEELRRVELVNERVLRVIDACPDETLVMVIAADCRGEAGGNHFSSAQGACFGFIKDHTAVGPLAATCTMGSNFVPIHSSGRSGAEQADNGGHVVRDPLTTEKSGTSSSSVSEMPPACQQQ